MSDQDEQRATAAGQAVAQKAGQVGGKIAKTVIKQGAKFALKAAGKALMGLVGPYIVPIAAGVAAVILLVLMVVFIVTVVVHPPAGQTRTRIADAARAAAASVLHVRSYDGVERQFALSPYLVAAITWDAQERDRTAPASEVARMLAPHFRYGLALSGVKVWRKKKKHLVYVGELHGGAVRAVVSASTYHGTATLTYGPPDRLVGRVPCPAGAGKHARCLRYVPRLVSVRWSGTDVRLLQVLRTVLARDADPSMVALVRVQAEQWAGDSWTQLGLPLGPGSPENGRLSAVKRWVPLLRQYATSVVPLPLLEAVTAVESGGDPTALSDRGAEGLMQVEPATAPGVDLFDPTQNVRAGSEYLQSLSSLYGLGAGCVARAVTDPGCQQALALVLAAYNAGPRTVAKAGGTVPAVAVPYVRDVEGLLSEIPA